jgi:prephenate dehydrogenase
VLEELRVHRDDLGPGARDMTRLAASDPSMWTPLLAHAPPETVDAIRRLTSSLESLANAIERQDTSAIAEVLERGRALHHRSDDV